MESRAVRASLRAVPDRPGQAVAYRQVASDLRTCWRASTSPACCTSTTTPS